MFYKMFSSCCFVWIINCCLIHFHLEVTSGGKVFVIQKIAKLIIFLYYSDSQNLYEVTIFISEILWPCNCDSVQFSSVAQSCPTLWDPMNLSTPGLLVHHQLPEFTQTHVSRVGDAIQPSHPLSSPSLPAPSPSQHQGLFPVSQLFEWGGQSTGVSASASVLPMNTQVIVMSPLFEEYKEYWWRFLVLWERWIILGESVYHPCRNAIIACIIEMKTSHKVQLPWRP